MLTLIKLFLKKVAHFTLGPGGYTRILYRLMLFKKSNQIKIKKISGLKGKNDYHAFETQYNIVKAGAEKFFEKKNIQRDLRRDIHRLEKGITSKNRRKFFGLEPCEACIIALEKDKCTDKSTDLWAYSVLSEYFNVVEFAEGTKLHKLFNRFTRLQLNSSINLNSYVSYKKLDSNRKLRTFESLVESRRSIRSFKNTKLDRKYVSEALSLAINSPSACNRLPFRFIVLDDDEMIRSVGELAAGTAGWLNNIPCLVTVVGDWSCFSDVADRNTPYIDASFSVIQLLLKLEKDHFGGCVINWKNTKEIDNEIRKLLKLDSWEHVIMLVAIGIPEEINLPLSLKKDLNSVVVWNS